MKKYRELTEQDLKSVCNPEALSFQTTEELEPLDGIIGQERAVGAMDFGLKIKMRGYNIYMSGPTGTGKTSYARSYVKNIAEQEAIPYDWCYVYNFDKPEQPQSLRFPAGVGRQFRDDLNELIELLLVEIPKVFGAEEYEKQKSEVVKEYQDKRDNLMKQMTDHAKELGFGVKVTNSGIYFMPIVDGEAISEKQYEELPEEDQEAIAERSDQIQEEATEIMRSVREIEKEAKKKVEDLEYKVGLFAVGHHISALREKYKQFERVIKYLERVQEDILENIQEFFHEEEEEEESAAALIPWVAKKTAEDVTLRYKVNLLVDHSETKGAPVVVDFNPTYYNLVGQVEYDNEFGNLTTDFTKIKPGLFHQANGGYLILQAHDLLSNVQSWEALKRIMKTKEISIENLREQLGLVAVASLKPEPIPLNVKVILVGSSHIYHLLYEYDEDFQKLFKIRVDFDHEMKRTDENVIKLARFIKGFSEREEVGPFDSSAVAKIVEYSTRIAEHQEKLSTRFNQLVEILCESSTWASLEGTAVVTMAHVKKAVEEKEYRSNLYEEKMEEMMESNVLMIDTDGEKVGQINGLAVLDTGDYTFAKPTRITATTYMGKSGIINIEKEADMSGRIHDKGVQVLAGYLGQTYAQEFPLALSCRVCFEQNYYGVDGDSASSTELYAILSSLAEAPIEQGIAVTGSINQRGEIQPIGGVSYKVEGFYNLCEKRSLTGKQGVIIPHQNVMDLVLKDEVIHAVKEGKFHIYAITHIEEGIEILTGMPAGIADQDGKYASDTIHGRVMRKLRQFDKRSMGQKPKNSKK